MEENEDNFVINKGKRTEKIVKENTTDQARPDREKELAK